MPEAPGAPRHLSAYSWRARLGVIVPPTNTVNEAEWARLMPEGTSFHTMRMPLHADTTSQEGQRALHDDLDKAMAELVKADVDVIAYACTAGSMTHPPQSLPERMKAASGRTGLTTAAAIVTALDALAAKRLAVATPYHEKLDAHERHFLEGCGFEVLAIAGLGIGSGGPHEYVRIAQTPLDAVAAHARSVMQAARGQARGSGRPDALLISCTDFPTLPLIRKLEAEFGIPVISSNTATLWHALRLAGIRDDIPAAGRLFERMGAAG